MKRSGKWASDTEDGFPTVSAFHLQKRVFSAMPPVCSLPRDQTHHLFSGLSAVTASDAPWTMPGFFKAPASCCCSMPAKTQGPSVSTKDPPCVCPRKLGGMATSHGAHRQASSDTPLVPDARREEHRGSGKKAFAGVSLRSPAGAG